jgi:hypothetical protein
MFINRDFRKFLVKKLRFNILVKPLAIRYLRETFPEFINKQKFQK